MISITLFGTLISLAILMTFSRSVDAANLTVKIKDISQPHGHLMVALFAGKEAYNKDKSDWSSKIEVTENEEQVTFENVPDGDYAIKLFHDENDNHKMDTNIVGIPKEGYGFSNNVGRFGQPAYKKAKFIIKNDTTIDINLF